MNIDIKQLKPILNKFVYLLKHYYQLIGIIIIAIIYASLIIQINLLSRKEPTDTQISEKLQKVSQPKIDESTVEKLKNLEENSTEVKALFKAARENPFQE